MDEGRRRSYLQALGIEAWERRASPPVAAVTGEAASVTAAPTHPGSAFDTLDWDGLEAAVAGCSQCPLHASRNRTVFGVGARDATWLVVGEAPGAEEDRQGEPFVGAAGKLLDAMLRAVGLSRQQVYIANMLKCRPPRNRDPAADELASCRPYLERQVALLAPRLVLVVGRVAAHALLGGDEPLGRLRGRAHRLPGSDIPLVVTYHPAYLLRSPREKRRSWQDLLLARSLVAGNDGGAG